MGNNLQPTYIRLLQKYKKLQQSSCMKGELPEPNKCVISETRVSFN